jgi:hypothetical protein
VIGVLGISNLILRIDKEVGFMPCARDFFCAGGSTENSLPNAQAPDV